MKPSLSQQSSLYAQVYEKKGTKGALAPVASRHDLRNEKDTKTSPQRKNKKTFSPTKAIAVLGGGLVGLTGLYMGVGQKIKTFLFGETPKPAPPSIPPTPVLFEVVADVPAPEKNIVVRATEAVQNSLQDGMNKHSQATQELAKTVRENAQAVQEGIKETAEKAATGAINQTRKMQNTATHMAIAAAEYMPTSTTGSVGLDLFAIAMHALYGAGERVVRHVKVPKP
jgi:hypothetical protein